MLKYGGDSVHLALHRVILGIWRTEQAPPDFKQDILLPTSKKGDASLCSNYRTIALQSKAGKAYANVLSVRLSKWLADNLLDEQCSFRPNSSTMDALFSLRLLCNGAWDKGKTLYTCMLDSTKAFIEGWPGRSCLAEVHPQSLLHSSRTSTHGTQQSSAAWFVPLQYTQRLASNMGVLAPLLFNICLDTVVRQLLPYLQRLGVTTCFKIDGQFRHCKNPTEEELMWILLLR